MALSLENKVALVTGGSRGIGRAIAIEFAARGAAVVVNYNKSPESAEEVVKTIQAAGGKAATHRKVVDDEERMVDGVRPGSGVDLVGVDGEVLVAVEIPADLLW